MTTVASDTPAQVPGLDAAPLGCGTLQTRRAAPTWWPTGRLTPTGI